MQLTLTSASALLCWQWLTIGVLNVLRNIVKWHSLVEPQCMKSRAKGEDEQSRFGHMNPAVGGDGYLPYMVTKVYCSLTNIMSISKEHLLTTCLVGWQHCQLNLEAGRSTNQHGGGGETGAQVLYWVKPLLDSQVRLISIDVMSI
jgi:hypothetical protein